jgi:hypothetical protein
LCVGALSENGHQEGALGVLSEGTGFNAPQVCSVAPLLQQQLQEVCMILSPNPLSSKLHFRPVVRNDSSCPFVLPAVSPAVDADRVDDANVAAGPALPQINGADTTNVANGAYTLFLCPLDVPFNVAARAAGGGEAIHLPLANNLLPVHPGEAGADNNMMAGRQQQSQQHLIANAAVAGVGGLDEVGVDSVRCPQNCNNIEAIDGINHAVPQAMRMISLAIGRVQPPAASAAIIAPGLNAANVLASLYTHLASARAVNRIDAMVCHEMMIDHLKRKEEEDLEACLN